MTRLLILSGRGEQFRITMTFLVEILIGPAEDVVLSA
jgi:hypothetical protein